MEDKAIDWSRGFETRVANPKHSDLFKTITKRRRGTAEPYSELVLLKNIIIISNVTKTEG